MVTDYPNNEPINIDTKLWIEILENERITKETNLEVFRTLLECKNSEENCTDLSIKCGKKSLNKLIACFGQRICRYYPNIITPKYKTGKDITFHIPFLFARIPNSSKWKWKLRPELKEALLNLNLQA